MKKIIIILFIFIVIAVCTNEKNNILIPDDAIRFRIIANSDSKNDQNLKKEIKTVIENEIYKIIASAKTINEARNLISSNLDYIDNIMRRYDVNYDIKFGSNYFPIKNYKGVTYKAGNYESLVITLGSGLGENWWCVLFPPLCLLDENNNIDDLKYTTYVEKLIKKFD